MNDPGNKVYPLIILDRKRQHTRKGDRKESVSNSLYFVQFPKERMAIGSMLATLSK